MNRFAFHLAVCFVVAGCDKPATPQPASAPPPADFQTVQDELASLRRALDEVARQRTTPASNETASSDGVTIRQVHEWAWGLEQRLVQLEQNAERSRASNPEPAPPPDIVQSRQAAIDAQAKPDERLAALRALRAANARTTDIVQAMVQLHASSTDPNVRADIFRQLSGVRDDILKPPLLDALRKDEAPKVREEAAETLAGFLADPYVRSALNNAAQNDPDEKVRKQARETLARHPER